MLVAAGYSNFGGFTPLSSELVPILTLTIVTLIRCRCGQQNTSYYDASHCGTSGSVIFRSLSTVRSAGNLFIRLCYCPFSLQQLSRMHETQLYRIQQILLNSRQHQLDSAAITNCHSVICTVRSPTVTRLSTGSDHILSLGYPHIEYRRPWEV